MMCLVTDRRRLSPSAGTDPLVALVGSAARAGVDLVQIRERDLSAFDLTQLVRRCLTAVRGTAAKVIVNDRVDVALAAGAHGVHLRADSIEAREARALLGADAVIGRSVHSPEDAAAAARSGGIDYLIFGTLFPTTSKGAVDRFATLEQLSSACRVSGVPVLAIGGMTASRAADVARAGGAGIAAIGLFIPPVSQAADRYLEEVVKELRRVFDTCGAVS